MDKAAAQTTHTLSELVDRLTIVQLKQVRGTTGAESFSAEMDRIEGSLDATFQRSGIPLNAQLVRLVIALAQMNLHIWLAKERTSTDRVGFSGHLKLSHQLNGVRNQLKNRLLQFALPGERTLAKSNVGVDGLEGWRLSILEAGENQAEAPPANAVSRGTLAADLIDAISILQIKELALTGERQAEATRDLCLQSAALDVCCAARGVSPSGRLLGLLVLLAQQNLQIWITKDQMQVEPERYDELLALAYDLNGLKNQAYNLIQEEFREAAPNQLRTTFLSTDDDRWYAPVLSRLGAPPLSAPEKLCDIQAGDLALFFGVEEQELDKDCQEILAQRDFRYKRLEGARRDEVILAVLKRIHGGELWVSGEDKRHIWERGWGENLEEYQKSGDLTTLKPKFLQAKKVLRLGRGYIEPEDPDFEFNIIDIFRRTMFRRHLTNLDAIYEFGCGSCQHLPVLAELFPRAAIHGLDWAEASVRIIDQLVRDTGMNLAGHRFNLFEPDHSLPLDGRCGVVTIGTMEQLGQNFDAFVEFLIRKGPAIVCHFESIIELYDDTLCDYLARIYDNKRNYLNGYLDRLRTLEQQGRIEVIETRRVYFGSMYHDSYSMTVWRPRS